ncbi:anacyclamide/piricyclamide family prenylated cyclic peptide [Streptomyces sp. 1222.5]|uniref:anacyclamide/piricyclamide family prenylated cyclic peptide n=1 Tax=Streptomyces sp. 1222.5 TaxID=1881026 RepID=UPI003D75E091
MTEQEQITPRLAAPVTRETTSTSSEPDQGVDLSFITGQGPQDAWAFAEDDAE